MPSLISSEDRLALYGMGLFETLLISGQAPLFPILHWQRMQKGGSLLGLAVPEFEEWYDQILTFLHLEESLAEPYGLRVTLSGGAPGQQLPPRLFCQSRPLAYSQRQHDLGLSLTLLTHPRNEKSPLTQIKSTNFLENVLAKQEAGSRGADEGIWLNTQGHLVEGTVSNLFFTREGQLFTPSLDSGCLPGTRRAIILEQAHRLQIPVYEEHCHPAMLCQADEIFLTNALMGMMPVHKIDDQSIPVCLPGDRNSVFRQLEQAFQTFSLSSNPAEIYLDAKVAASKPE